MIVAETSSTSDGPILLATDFGPVSAAAERAAIGQAGRAGVPLLVVHAIDPGRLRLPGGRFRMRFDEARAVRERDAATLVERARALGVDARVLIWDGDPASCIVEAARGEGAARIVIGSHGRGRLGRTFAGSVSNRVARLAACPVEVVAADGA